MDSYRLSRRRLLASVPAVAAARAMVFADEGAPKPDVGALVDRAVSEFLSATPQAMAVSVGVVRGAAGHTAHYGSLTKAGSRRPADDTVYPLASITKTFTGILLAQAAIEGRVTLDDDIRRYLDGEYRNLAFEGQPIRLWHLLNHNSGLPFNLPDIPETRPPFAEPSADVRRRLASYGRADFDADLKQVKLAAVPGTRFGYSNAAATLLSYILERVYGTTFEAALKRHITAPLAMNDTGIALTPSQAARLAPGYDEKGGIAPAIDDRLLGAGAVKSTVPDMLKYARWQIAEDGPAVKLSHRPHPIDGKYSIGLNWQIINDGTSRRIWQEGSLPGYCSMCVVVPERKLGLVAFANQLDRESAGSFGKMTQTIVTGLEPSAATLF